MRFHINWEVIIPIPILKIFYTNTEVVELIKKEIQKLSKPKHLTYQEVLEQQKQNNPNAFKQQQ
jgi:hypothetical protein